MTKYVIVGSGIIGLYTAYNLLLRGVSPREITIVAEHLPGDESINYTSPYAGGNFSCITDDDPKTLFYDKHTYTNLSRLQKELGGAPCGLDRYISTEYWDTKPSKEKIESLASYLQEYEIIDQMNLPMGVAYGIKFRSWNFNCPKFLLNFQKYLQEKGIRFIKRKLTHITQAYLTSSTKTVFNCTGIGAHKLGGVNDTNVYPTRGQVVVIKAPHIVENVMRWGEDYATYIIKRPYSKDQLILGGYMQKDNWTADTYKHETEDILKRTTELFPKILADNPYGNDLKDLEILRVVSGLRPSRYGGVRIEKSLVEHNKYLVHNYGASGYGYQAGLGMGYEAVRLALARDNNL
ncbi:D-aspartate oxidase [Scheffersomyces stipitis CBS 6054]|uniref:D-aspartate oxidase n=1 Tax=Scheffersomyces stipitis (strain ATCC 58785 / CBS 6054 / NBRC 10063 / NRRL Y-11545) TaxID=322104 RepID=A3LZE6_PICST|nr:D-aspartate oxidase [Scheffersomyces stipitis CBS 6054]ABN68145.2 D-aspartate oxidase [Scheffersomyces stipitis CBS 6054]